MEKKGAEWMVVQPIEYRADQAAVARAIHQIKAMEVKSPISNKPEKQSVFQVDSTGIEIKIYEHNLGKVDFVLWQDGAKLY